MFILLPIISFFLFWICSYNQIQQGTPAFLYAAALWGIIVWFLTETLSLFHALSFTPLLVTWSIIIVIAAYQARPYQIFSRYLSFCDFIKSLAFSEKFILFLIISIALLKCFSALYSAPNTCDAMTYHLNRVEHWIQNRSIAHYPTHVTRQLYSPPWAEYVILQLRILSNGDYFSNAVQWFSAIGSWVTVAGLAKLLGANRKGQLFSVLLAACLPMGLVQATSTQTDYVMTFWVIGFIYLLWVLYQKPSWKHALAAGIYLGLACLTKGNAYLFTPIWIVVFLIARILTRDFPKLKLLGLILLVACIINLPYAIRNTSTFKTPYWTCDPLTNKSLTFPILISNMNFNLALHLHNPPSTGEDDASNEVYLIVMMLVLLFLTFFRPMKHRIYLLYGSGVVLMFIIFSAVVHCDPYNSRFHLAIFVISTPLIGTVLMKYWPHRWVWLAAILIYMSSGAWLLKCNEHPLIGDRSIFKTIRSQQYFSTRPDLIYPYIQTVKLIASSNCRDIGLVSDEDEWGYPYWVFFRQNFGDKFRMEDVDVKNMSASLSYPNGDFQPCLLIASNDARTVITLDSGVYARAWFMELPQSLTSIFIKVR